MPLAGVLILLRSEGRSDPHRPRERPSGNSVESRPNWLTVSAHPLPVFL